MFIYVLFTNISRTFQSVWKYTHAHTLSFLDRALFSHIHVHRNACLLALKQDKIQPKEPKAPLSNDERRKRDIDRWRREEMEADGGSGKRNANFTPLGGDWKKRRTERVRNLDDGEDGPVVVTDDDDDGDDED